MRGIDDLRSGRHAVDDLAAAGHAGRLDGVAGAVDDAEIELERRLGVFLLGEAGRRIAAAEEKEPVGRDARRGTVALNIVAGPRSAVQSFLPSLSSLSAKAVAGANSAAVAAKRAARKRCLLIIASCPKTRCAKAPR
jgi:hypothetical protein